MANKKISAFDTISTIAGGPINLNEVLGVAAYCDDPSAPGTDVNVSFSGQDIIDSFLWTRNSNVNNIYYDAGSVNIGTSTNYNNIPLVVEGTGSNSMSTAVIVLDNTSNQWFSLRDDKRIVYQDGNQGLNKVLTSDGTGVATWQAPGGGGAQKFVLTLAYAFDQTTTTFTVRNLAWNGNVNMSGASTTSVDDGSWYVNDSFNITKVVARYAGRNSITMGGTDNLTLELKYLTPSSVGPNSWSAVSNEPTSPSTLITDFGNNLDLALADNGTWPWKTFTPGAPITITADTMLVCTATETSSITPTAGDYFVQIYCEYV